MAIAQPVIGVLPELPPVDGSGGDLSGVAKQYLADVRGVLAERHRAGASGSEVVAAYTGAIDRLVSFLFNSATAEYTRRYVMLDHRCTVAAQGGYGRSELNPASDIDLLVLYPWQVNAYVETVAERILYALWDAGLVVGHASRTVAGCVRLAQQDLKVKTALLDARYPRRRPRALRRVRGGDGERRAEEERRHASIARSSRRAPSATTATATRCTSSSRS